MEEIKYKTIKRVRRMTQDECRREGWFDVPTPMCLEIGDTHLAYAASLGMNHGAELIIYDTETGRSCSLGRESHFLGISSLEGFIVSDLTYLPERVYQLDVLPPSECTAFLLNYRYYVYPLFGGNTAALVGYDKSIGREVYYYPHSQRYPRSESLTGISYYY